LSFASALRVDLSLAGDLASRMGGGDKPCECWLIAFDRPAAQKRVYLSADRRPSATIAKTVRLAA
jgi:hypothetical protein